MKDNRPTDRPQLANQYAKKQRITNVAGWRKFVHTPVPTKPALPSMTEWESWSEAERMRYNRTRYVYHGGFAPIATPDLQDFHN